MRKKFDPISIEVYWNRLINIMDETAATLVKTSFSSVVRDFHDYACTLFDEDLTMLVQSTHTTPGLLGVLPQVAKNIARIYPPEKLNPGDVLITNDPWLASGHLIDISVYTPIFYRGRIIGYALCIVHHTNIGGRFASIDSTDIFEEGLKIPVSKICKKGEFNEELFDIIRGNVRVPETVIGDIKAQIQANDMQARLVMQFIDKEKIDDLRELGAEVVRRTEKSMREKILAIPDDRSSHEMILRNVIEGIESIRLKAEVIVQGSEIYVDFAGTSAQVGKALNCTYNFTRAYTVYPLKCMIDPEVPNNEGCIRPIKMSAPEGSILNPVWPAATFGRTMIAHFVTELIIMAMSKLLPREAIAASGSTALLYLTLKGSTSDGKPYLAVSSHFGGLGARFSKDGPSCRSFPCNVSNIPIEINESGIPIYFKKKSITCDSGGPGQYRGGCGQEVILKVLDDPAVAQAGLMVSLRGGRLGVPVEGLFGGWQAPGENVAMINGQLLPNTNKVFTLWPGDELCIRYLGGGGFGSPVLRDPYLVKEDVQNGLVSIQNAQEVYRVAIDPVTLEIDHGKTDALRQSAKDEKRTFQEERRNG
jgi:N-methylhydantoinase B